MSLQSLLHEPAVSQGTTSFSGLSGLRDRASFSVIVVSGALSMSGTSSADPTKVWEAPYVHEADATGSGPGWELKERQAEREPEATRKAVAELRRISGLTWDHYLDAWLERVPKKDRFIDVAGVVTALDDLTASEYVESDPLDLEHLSSREG